MSALHPAYRFDTLVVGAANRLAVTAARAVAESPGTGYNPLFVYARPGLGKTHLLQAVGHHARALDARLAVEYLALDEFVEAFHAAVAAGQGEAWRRRFAELDLLLLDDVQFLSQRREMQAELLRVIDALQRRQRQIVLTSDRPPAEIEALDERLIRRFAGGLVIDIAVPDYETQVAILRRKAEERRTAFAPGVLEAVATLGIHSVRELIGALNRLVAFQAVSEAPLDAEQARILVGGSLPPLEPAVAEEPPAPPAAVAPARPAAPPAALPEAEVPPGFVRAAEAPAPAASAGGEADEFGDFLSELAATLAAQVEPWRARVGEAILRWEGEGFRTAVRGRRLEVPEPEDPVAVLEQYEADAERLLALRAEARELAPDLAGAPALHDPGNLAVAEGFLQRLRDAAVPPPAPAPHWVFEDFVEGAVNRMAVRAAHAVALDPGAKYNPLVVVGAPGTGKTHLLHALGNALAPRAGGPVACLSAHDFTQELIDAIDRDAVPVWRNRYRRCGALLLDDVQLLADKERTQEELFLLFNLFAETGRQLAFASAAPLAALTGIEARLLTRLEGGLVVELPPPDRELRQRLVERLLAAREVPAEPELVAYVAARPAESVRALQGTLQRVLNAAEAQQARPTAALAREVLEGAVRPPRRSAPVRASGVVGPAAGGIRSREKMVWQWPEALDRLIEDWR